jgi:hypothetical protein
MASIRPSLLFATTCALALAHVSACGGGRLGPPPGTGTIDVDGGAAGGTAGAGVIGTGGAGGAGGSLVPAVPCAGDADPRLVLAPQRTVLLTSGELLNMIRALTDDREANAIVDNGIFAVTSDFQRRFPPALSEPFRRINDSTDMAAFNHLAKHVAQYVFDNFTVLSGCAAPATDACAQTYLDRFAEKAYRRPLDASEQASLNARYNGARGTDTAEAAAQQVVYAVLTAPPFLYRSERGDPTRRSTTLPALTLAPYELASALSFFLTDGPPDPLLLDAARTGTLAETLPAHVDRLLATPAARAWLTKIMETYFLINQLPGVLIDPTKFPIVEGGALYVDLQIESRMFLEHTLWNGTLAHLVTSRTAFLNAPLASEIYKVPPPPGATAVNFVPTLLPAAQRSGLLTNAGFLTRLARAAGASVIARGLAVNALMLCREVPPPPDEIDPNPPPVTPPNATAQEEVAIRAKVDTCNSCHKVFDAYGLALDNYDIIGRFRTADDLGRPVDAHATLPPVLGGTTVTNGVELARVIAESPAYTDCLVSALMRYAMVEDVSVEVPDTTTGRAGCAVANVVRRLERDGLTFPRLVREIALSPTFVLRADPPLLP